MTDSQEGSFSFRYAGALFTLCVVAMALLQLRVPYLNELWSHLTDAAHIWRGEVDCAAVYRLPLGYAGLLAPFVAAIGEAAGVKLANMLAFAGLLAAALAFFAQAHDRGGVRALPFGMNRTQAVAAVLLAALTLYPYMILNVARTTEAVPAAALLLLFLWALFKRPSVAIVVVAGLSLGVGMHVRANMSSLLMPAALWIVWRTQAGWGRRCLYGLLGAGALGAAYAAVSLLLTSCAWYSPTNGGYNLYAGNNPLSAQFLRSSQNAEYSIVPALRASGIQVKDVEDSYNLPQANYMALALQYMRDCPLCVAKLAVTKTTVFFAPRLANATGTAAVAAQTALAMVTWLAAGLALWRFVRRRGYADAVLLTVFVAYALPFALTNADPRLRFPLDIVALCYLALRLNDWLARRPLPSGRPSPGA